MPSARSSKLFELADLILAVGRHIEASKQVEGEQLGTPLQGAVMRYVDRHPGATAGEVADATKLISSNFARAVSGLEKAGLVRREADHLDGRRVRLYPTEKAAENLARLRATWSRLLGDAVTDVEDIDTAIATLRLIEARLLNRTGEATAR